MDATLTQCCSYFQFLFAPSPRTATQNGRPAYMIHFTYGNDFDEKGQFTPGKVGFWHWWAAAPWAVHPPRASVTRRRSVHVLLVPCWQVLQGNATTQLA